MKFSISPKLQKLALEIKQKETFSIKDVFLLKSLVSSEKKMDDIF